MYSNYFVFVYSFFDAIHTNKIGAETRYEIFGCDWVEYNI